MSLSSIISRPDPEPKSDTPIKVATPYVKQEVPVPVALPPQPKPAPAVTAPVQTPLRPSPASVINATPITNGESRAPPRSKTSGPHAIEIDERVVASELAKIDDMDLSDVEAPGFESEKREYFRRGLKRQAQLVVAETDKRKVIMLAA